MSMRDYLKGRSPRGRIDSRAPTTKIVLLSIALLVLLTGAIALFVRAKSAVVSTDPLTLCPTDRPPAEVVVLLLDMSDEFTDAQRLKIRNEFDRLKARIARFGLIEAYAVDSQQRVTSAVVHLCNPGSGEDLSRVYQNPELARRKWDGFVRQLDVELERLMTTPQSSTSPIFEAVQATALRTFNLRQYDGVPKRLGLVSDLMQNVPGKLSHYTGIVPFDQFRKSAYFSDIRADLTGVAVTLFYLVRPQSPQIWPDHRIFWEKYFLAQGATVELVEPVYGAK